MAIGAVSELTERLWADYQAFATRDLSELELLYLFVDGIAERLHLGQPREPVLAAWGITTQGQKVLLGLAPGVIRAIEEVCGRSLRQRTRRPVPCWRGWRGTSSCAATSASCPRRRPVPGFGWPVYCVAR